MRKAETERIRTAWQLVTEALGELSDGLECDRAKFGRLLNALMGLKMALEIEESGVLDDLVGENSVADT